MPFERGHVKLGGRKKGSANKSRMYLDICEKLESEGYDLVGEAVKLLRKRTTPLEYKVRLMLGIMAHTHPKRLAIATQTRVQHQIDRETWKTLINDATFVRAIEIASLSVEQAKERKLLPAP